MFRNRRKALAAFLCVLIVGVTGWLLGSQRSDGFERQWEGTGTGGRSGLGATRGDDDSKDRHPVKAAQNPVAEIGSVTVDDATDVSAIEVRMADRNEQGQQDLRERDWSLAERFCFAPHAVEVTSLLRHRDLNPAGAVIAADERAALRDIVVTFQQQLGPLVDAYHTTKSSEMIEHIEQGVVEEFEPPAPSEERLNQYATILANARKQFGRPGSVDQIRNRLRERPHAVSLVGRSHILHKGKVYLHSAFDSLPRTDLAWKTMHAEKVAFLGAVCNWFISSGYTEWGYVAHELQAAVDLVTR